MDNYIVSARKYRPATFDAVVGQQALTTTLKNACKSGKLAHAYLFCGPRGVGKTTCARIFAKTINCLNPNAEGEACNECESCQAFNEQRSLNIHELDAASNNSVDDMRQLIEQVQVPPQIGRYKVFIIDEVHMLSTQAFNAFLKTLEEPPAHAIFILATTEKHKILPTILSRCQIYDFNRMDVGLTVAHLKRVAEQEGISCEDEALNLIAQKADGGMRDALSIFDQVASFTGGNITYKKVIEDLNILDYDYYFSLTDQLLKADVPAAMLTLDDVLSRGFQANHFMEGLAAHFRSLLVAHDAQTLHLLEGSDALRQRYAEQSRRCQPRMLYAALRLCNQCDVAYRQSNNKRLLVELTLIQVAQLSDPAPEAGAPGSGLGPTKILKPIFQLLAAKAAASDVAPNPTITSPSAATPPTGKTSPPTGATTPPIGKTSPPTVQSSGTQAPTPQATARPAAVARHTISITRRPAGPAPTAAAQANAATSAPDTHAVPSNLGTTPFTERDFNYQWLRFANELPVEQFANAGRLKSMSPHVEAGSTDIEVMVPNEKVLKYMQELHPSLLTHLRRELNNRLINVHFKVSEAQTGTRYRSPYEAFAEMQRTQPIVKQLQESLQLEVI